MSGHDSFYTELTQSSTLSRGLNFIFTKFATFPLKEDDQLLQLEKSFKLLFELFPNDDWQAAIQNLNYSNDQLHYLCQFLCQHNKNEAALEILRHEASKTQNRPSLILQNALYDLETKQSLQNTPYDLSTRICPAPFETLLVSPDGSCRFCFWSVSLGNLKEKSLTEIWQGETAKKIRSEMLEGKFQFCNQNICYRFRQNSLPEKEERLKTLFERSHKNLDDHIKGKALPCNFELSYDRSCPHQCPSCREVIQTEVNQELSPHELKRITEEFQVFFKTVKIRRLLMSGYGEFSTSPYMHSILENLSVKEHPDLKLHLLTSGNSSFTDLISKHSHLKGHFQRIYVSFDTLVPNSFSQIRSSTGFPSFLKNLYELAALKKKGEIQELILVCTLQELNFRELPQLVQKALEIDATEIRFKRLRQRGTFKQKDFEQRDICSPQHPLHSELKSIIEKNNLNHPKVNLIDIFFDKLHSLNGE